MDKPVRVRFCYPYHCMSEVKKATSIVTLTLDLDYKYPRSREAWLSLLELSRAKATITESKGVLFFLNLESKRPAEFVYSIDRRWPELSPTDHALWTQWHDALDSLRATVQFGDQVLSRALILVDLAAEEMDGTEPNLEARLSQRSRRALMNVQRLFKRYLASNWNPSVPVDHYDWNPFDELWDAVRPIETLSDTRKPAEGRLDAPVRTHGAPAQTNVSQTPTSETLSIDDCPNRFQLVGTVWHVRFGSEYGNFDRGRTRGFQYIWSLLSAPNPTRALSAVDLYQMVNPPLQGESPATYALDSREHNARRMSHQEFVDTTSLEELKDSLALLRESLEEADTPAERHLIQSEVAKLESLLRRSTGLGGRSRAFPASESRSARENIRAAIKLAFRHFHNANPPMMALAKHLDDHIRYEGDTIAYRPPGQDPISWKV